MENEPVGDGPDEVTPSGIPTGAIAEHLFRLARSLASTGIVISRFAGVVEQAEPALLAASLVEVESEVSDLCERVHGARRAVRRVRTGQP